MSKNKVARRNAIRSAKLRSEVTSQGEHCRGNLGNPCSSPKQLAQETCAATKIGDAGSQGVDSEVSSELHCAANRRLPNPRLK